MPVWHDHSIITLLHSQTLRKAEIQLSHGIKPCQEITFLKNMQVWRMVVSHCLCASSLSWGLLLIHLQNSSRLSRNISFYFFNRFLSSFFFFPNNPSIILTKHFNIGLKEFVLSLLFWDSCSENPETFIFLKGLCVVWHNLGKITQWKFKNYWSTTLFFDQRFLQILIDLFTELWNLPGDQILLNIFIIKFWEYFKRGRKKNMEKRNHPPHWEEVNSHSCASLLCISGTLLLSVNIHRVCLINPKDSRKRKEEQSPKTNYREDRLNTLDS